MRIKLVSVLITLLIASAVMFAGCIEKDKSTKVSEIIASPTSTPIILPTSTPTSGTGMVNLENPLIPKEFQADYFMGEKGSKGIMWFL
jgi:hypothetical protein